MGDKSSISFKVREDLHAHIGEVFSGYGAAVGPDNEALEAELELFALNVVNNHNEVIKQWKGQVKEHNRLLKVSGKSKEEYDKQKLPTYNRIEVYSAYSHGDRSIRFCVRRFNAATGKPGKPILLPMIHNKRTNQIGLDWRTVKPALKSTKQLIPLFQQTEKMAVLVKRLSDHLKKARYHAREIDRYTELTFGKKKAKTAAKLVKTPTAKAAGNSEAINPIHTPSRRRKSSQKFAS